MKKLVLGAAALASLSACDGGEGVSTAEISQAAEERVRQSLGLTPDSALFTNVFVGEPADGDTVLCGTVAGTRSDGSPVSSRRFIAALDPARWYRFERPEEIGQVANPDFLLEWQMLCAQERGDNSEEPLAVTERAEEQ